MHRVVQLSGHRFDHRWCVRLTVPLVACLLRAPDQLHCPVTNP
jgi:hypothetical protein